MSATAMISWYYLRRINMLRAQCYAEHGTSMYVFLRKQLRATTMLYILVLFMVNLTLAVSVPYGTPYGTWLYGVLR